ncbi:hypothetical protein GC163_13600 [bacterium]|nr:hypothetical protein [bacterium]
MARDDSDFGTAAYDDSRPKRKSKTGCWIWALVITILGMIFGGIACCGGFFYFGLNVFNDEMKAQVKDNPVLIEHIGELESMSINFVKTGEVNSEDTIVYDVKGSKASGTLAVEHTQNGDGDILVISATLTLADGQTFELFDEEVDEAMPVEENMSPDVKAEPVDPAAAPAAAPDAAPATPE